jgi:hypothetical protein
VTTNMPAGWVCAPRARQAPRAGPPGHAGAGRAVRGDGKHGAPHRPSVTCALATTARPLEAWPLQQRHSSSVWK